MKEEIRAFVSQHRRDFQNAPLGPEAMNADPVKQFGLWFEEAVKAEVFDPYAFTLATSGKDGKPSARVVYMRDVSDSGLSFFTNYASDKGRDLEENPWACANFYWSELSRQVRFVGKVAKLPVELSDAYFASRPRESQIGAWASDQSSELQNREELEQKVLDFTNRFEATEVPRPPHWGGYLIQPETVEFWQGRESRLHDRIVYQKELSGLWKRVRLSP
jgi:pyridoxamine 5'-phosphate oxidase